MENNTAVKHDAGKWRMSDLPQKSLISICKAFNYGADKYGKFNYSKGMEWTRYYDACQRHLNDWMLGTDIDESGNHHIDHAIASLMMLRENIHMSKGLDDRNHQYNQK